MSVESWFKIGLEFAKAGWRVWAIFAGATGIIMTASLLMDVPESVRVICLIFFAFSASGLLVATGELVFKFFKSRCDARRKDSEQDAWMDALTKTERDVLARFVELDMRSTYLPWMDPVVMELRRRGFITSTAPTGQQDDSNRCFTIVESAWKRLKKKES